MFGYSEGVGPFWRVKLDLHNLYGIKDQPETQKLRSIWGRENIEWTKEPGKCSSIKVSMPKDSIISGGVDEQGVAIPIGGAGFIVREGIVPEDELFLKYALRIPQGFEWVKGGKLPGLGGGTFPTGG